MTRNRRKLPFTKNQIIALAIICLVSLVFLITEILILSSKIKYQNLPIADEKNSSTGLPIQEKFPTLTIPTLTIKLENPEIIPPVPPFRAEEPISEIKATNTVETLHLEKSIEETTAPTKTLIVKSDTGDLKLSDQPMLIGKSVSGRPILVYRFGTGSLERLIIAGIHGGNEYNTVLLAQALIEYLKENPGIVPEEVSLYILPNLNPDGYARAWDIYGRANDHGVDLNHNFPFEWKQDWDRDGCWRYLYLNGGTEPASEPETKAFIDFILNHHIDALISYHSAALGIFAGGDPPHSSSLQLAEMISKVSSYPYPAIDTGCEITGSLTDWSAAKDIASVDIELTNHRNTDFQENLVVLSIFLNWRR
jgi:predicted deacylase